PKAERAAAAGPSTAAGTVTFDLSALRADPKDLLRLVQLDATPGDSSVTPANGGLRFEATVAGSSRICTGRFGVRGPGVARAHVRVPTLAPGAAKWQTLRLDAGFFGDDHKPVLEGGKPASSGVDVPASAAWAWIELPIEPPEGTAEVQVCLRFAKSTGVAEIDRLEAKGGAGR
ncbi:MAG TPA: hypothetical protein PKA64_11390, partial [Myxococcota bacterium]|nr:hypothetical protein [Myxococcota bacterium]